MAAVYIFPTSKFQMARIKLKILTHPSILVFMSADLSVSWHYVVTLRRGRTRTRPRMRPRTRPREQLLLQNYKA